MAGQGANLLVLDGKVFLDFEEALDLFFDLIHLGKALQRLLREDLLLIQKDLERSGLARRDGDAAQPRVIIVQEVLRQTGGTCQVASAGTVFDPDFTRPLARRVGAGHRVSFRSDSMLGKTGAAPAGGVSHERPGPATP